MYLEPFKLKELPFRLSPDPQFLYLSKQHARAKAYMESTIWFTDGFVVITGDIGSGKTTLIEAFLKEIPADVVVAQINQTQVNATDFLQAVLVQFGFSPFKMRKAELISTLNNFLIEQHAAGRKVLLIVDEAQNLEPRVLEEIRLLSGVETTKEKVLRIILAGQPELNDTLNSPRLEQLTQRVRLRFHLSTLSEAETRAYIEHRLEVAGAGDREIFAADTFPEIYRYAGGGRDARLHRAPARGRRRRRSRDLRGRHLPRDLPLRRRGATAHQYAVRHRDDGGLHGEPQLGAPPRRLERDRGAALAAACSACAGRGAGPREHDWDAPGDDRAASGGSRRPRGLLCGGGGGGRRLVRSSCARG